MKIDILEINMTLGAKSQPSDLYIFFRGRRSTLRLTSIHSRNRAASYIPARFAGGRARARLHILGPARSGYELLDEAAKHDTGHTA